MTTFCVHESEIFKKYGGEIEKIAKHYYYRLPYHDCIDVSDAISEAKLAVLYELRRKYDIETVSDEDVRKTFGQINYAIRRAVWKHMGFGRIHNHAPENGRNVSIDSIADVHSTSIDESRVDVERFLRTLPDMQSKIVFGMMNGLKCTEISNALGIPYNKCYNELRNVRKSYEQYFSA